MISNSPPIDRVVASLRQRLPPGAPVVFLPSVRARDYAEVIRGHALPLGLVSQRFGLEWMGLFNTFDAAQVFIFRGVLEARHQTALIGILEGVAKVGGPAVLVADEFDAQILSLLMANHNRGTLRISALSPCAHADATLATLSGLTGATLGIAGESLVMGSVGRAPRILSSVEDTLIIADGSDSSARPIGVVYVGGRDLGEASQRAASAR